VFLERLVERRAVENQYGAGTLTDSSWISKIVGSSGGVSTSGLVVNEWTAEGISSMYACQRAISETAGQIPIKLQYLDQGRRRDADDDRLYFLLHDLPNPEMTAYQFKEMMTRFLAQWGRSYAQILWDDRGPSALWPLLPWRMTVDRDASGRKRWRYTATDGSSHEWMANPNQPPILDLHINSIDGLVGRSPVRVLMDAIGLTQAVEQFGAEYFKNYSAPALSVSLPGKLTDAGRQHLREEWQRFRGDWGTKHRTVILQEGMKVDKISNNPNEAQFIETRGLQIEEIARIYRTPLAVIQHMTKSTTWGSGIEQILLHWLATGLNQYLVQWQQAIMRDLVTPRLMAKRRVIWVTAALVQTDIKTRGEALEIRKRNGIINANEWRELEDMNPRNDEFGDQYDVAVANTMPASLAKAKLLEDQTPDPDPAPPAVEDDNAE
jgi:HK97 family phage portal protein